MRLPVAFAVLTLVALLPGTELGAQSPGMARAADSALVVFVCEHGSVKSMIAATLFNRMASERKLAARAVSRGTVPDSAIPTLVRDGLRAEGVDLGAVRPQGLGAADARGAWSFVTFDVDVPRQIAGPVPVRRWDGTPSVMRAYPVGRDSIASRVAALVSELERTRSGTASPRP